MFTPMYAKGKIPEGLEHYITDENSIVINTKSIMKKPLKPTKIKDGYLRYHLRTKDKKDVFILGHVITATYFVENNNENYTQVNHKDRNTQNNRADNLEWCDQMYNNHYDGHVERSAEGQRNSKKFHEAMERRGTKVMCVETGIVYNSISEAARSLGLLASGIRGCVHGRRNTCGNLHWKLVDTQSDSEMKMQQNCE